jgi:hypothetical protein
MGGTNTIVMHSLLARDSLLATPLIYDLVILGELCERITIWKAGTEGLGLPPFLSLLSPYRPQHLNGAPVISTLFTQRQAIINVVRALPRSLLKPHDFGYHFEVLWTIWPSGSRPAVTNKRRHT